MFSAYCSGVQRSSRVNSRHGPFMGWRPSVAVPSRGRRRGAVSVEATLEHVDTPLDGHAALSPGPETVGLSDLQRATFFFDIPPPTGHLPMAYQAAFPSQVTSAPFDCLAYRASSDSLSKLR